MQKITKFLSFALASVMMVSAVACSGGGDDSSPTSEQGVSASSSGGGTSSVEPVAQAYTGYDGYVWKGTERTEEKVANFALEYDTLESTIGIQNAPMNEYFDGAYVDLSNSYVAMMCYYVPTANKTGYSKTIVEEVTVYAQSAGNLSVGSAKVADVETARASGTTLSCKMTTYAVQKGLNTLSVNVFVDNESTLVLGGNGSVGLYYAKDVNENDQQGVFTVLDGSAHGTQTYSMSGATKNKLAIQTTIVTMETIADDNKTTYSGNVTGYNEVAFVVAPFAYQQPYFTNAFIKAIEIPVCKFGTTDADQTFTIWVGDKDVSKTGNFGTQYTISIPRSSMSVNAWVTVDLTSYGIYVNANQTLLFGKDGDSLVWAWSGGNKDAGNAFHHSNGAGNVMANDDVANLMFNVYMVKDDHDVPSYVSTLKREQAVVDALSGKYVSIIGDSISTFEGWNNNAETNTLLGAIPNYKGPNAVFYNPTIHHTVIDKADDCWWKLTADRTGMEVLVNGAWSGSATIDETGTANDGVGDAWVANASTSDRAINLHANAGVNSGKDPDVIFCFMGTNDCIRHGGARTCGTYEEVNFNTLITKNGNEYTYNIPNRDGFPIFAHAYATMLHKMQTRYPNAQIFCMTVMPFNGGSHDNHVLQNDVIEKMASHFGCGFIDLYGNSGLTWSNYTQYTVDGLHPNEKGMQMMSDCVMRTLVEFYG